MIQGFCDGKCLTVLLVLHGVWYLRRDVVFSVGRTLLQVDCTKIWTLQVYVVCTGKEVRNVPCRTVFTQNLAYCFVQEHGEADLAILFQQLSTETCKELGCLSIIQEALMCFAS